MTIDEKQYSPPLCVTIKDVWFHYDVTLGL